MSIIRITVEIDTDKTGDPTDVGQLSLTDYLVDQVTPKVKRQLRELARSQEFHALGGHALFSADGTPVGTVKVEVDPKSIQYLLYNQDSYDDKEMIGVYDDEKLAEKALARYDEAWGNYYLDELPLNPPIPGPGNVYRLKLDCSGALLAHPSAHAWFPDHQDWSDPERTANAYLEAVVPRTHRTFVVWAEGPSEALAHARAEWERLVEAGLWNTPGRYLFGELEEM